MKLTHLVFLLITSMLSACIGNQHKTIAGLQSIEIEISNINIDGGLEKAMQGYQQFLEKTPESAMTPEAIRRLADLNIEKEYGVISDTEVKEQSESQAIDTPKVESVKNIDLNESGADDSRVSSANKTDIKNESIQQFEARATQQQVIQKEKAVQPAVLPDGTKIEDLQTEGAVKAIALYLKLLKKFPLYERNDQVLYQLSRAYEETGQIEQAMGVMNRLVDKYPHSRHFAEVQFRRAEYFFTRKKLLDAEDAYKSILDLGVGTGYYALALYKIGWTFYKQELYEDGLVHFIGLLDHKVAIGYDFEQTHNEVEKKRIDDTYRVISLSFSNLGGSEAVKEFFDKYGSRSYDSEVYRQLAEYYLAKRRYSDAAKTYNAYIEQNPYHKVSPHFSMRVIEIYQKGGFPKLVIEAKKDFASTYGLTAKYWKYFNPDQHTDVVAYLKKNIIDLANHYHAVYQDKRLNNKKASNFKQASHWYKEFLLSFPQDELSAGINYQLADLYLENKDYLSAAIEYEKTAYNYKINEKSSKAGYAAVYSYREHLKRAPQFEKNKVKREVIRVSLRFVDVFPTHDKAAIILAAAADDLYDLKDFQLAINASHQLINNYPGVDTMLRRSSWLLIAYASFDLHKYSDAETAFINVLAIKNKGKDVKKNEANRKELQENLAAAIYKQGELAVKLQDYKAAASHFLRVGERVPKSKIRSTAEYDAATALIQLKEWPRAINVLQDFRGLFPKHKLQPDITKKLAYAYKEHKQFDKAAVEFERIAKETTEETIKRESLLVAAELYEKISDKDNELRIYKNFVKGFPKPVDESLEIYMKIANIYQFKKDRESYINTLKQIVTIDSKAGKARTDRTRYLAGKASLELIAPLYDNFVAIKLVQPFKKNLKKKRKVMKANIKKYNDLVDYQVGDVTAAATYYIAETYYAFSRSLMESERPKNLSELELEQYNEIIEEQAYPFEEKGINIHKKNLELLSVGVYSQWIDKSLKKLGERVPGRYAKYEVSTGVLVSMLNYKYIVQKKPENKQVTETTNIEVSMNDNNTAVR